MPEHDYKISIIMPALNEENNIVRTIENVIGSFREIGVSGEIIVANDGSTDRTQKIVEGLMRDYPFVRLINHVNPKGIGASFWDSVNESRGEIVIMLPGDGENDASEILRYLPLMEHVDIVIPFIHNQGVRPWRRRMLSKLYKAIINLSFGMLLNYMNGTVMYRKCILDNIDLKANGFFYQTELLIKCLKNGYLYAEVPCWIGKRESGKSKAVTLKSFLQVVKGYLSAMSAVYIYGSKNKSPAPSSVTVLRRSQF